MEREKLIVVIPAYEPPREFINYALRVAAFSYELVVVNDGSNAEYNDIFDRIAEISNVKYITYEQNRGKGYALKQAFRYCTEKYGDDHVIVTADCDGQHSIEDLERVASVSIEHSNALILGSRNFDNPNVPRKSKMGNKSIRSLFHALYGLDVNDTQTGLRGFSVKLAEKLLTVYGDRFEYEMEMLIYAQKSGISVLEIPIKTIYPDDPKDHVTHFKAFRDSTKIVSVVLRNLNWYILSSTLSGVLDILVFFLLSSVVLGNKSALNTLIATISARVISSILNFCLNRKYVFAGKSKRSIYRYYILWLCQLGASYGLIFLFGNVLGLPMTPMKIVGDVFLGILSYQIQRSWVFRNGNEKRIYGASVRVVRFFARLFTRKYKSNVVPPDEPTVYVCRHLNLHGPLTTMIHLGFDVRPMVLSVFFEKGKCYDQYANYTFTERRGKKKGKHNFKAYVSSRVVPSLVRSAGSIPVYRDSSENSYTTLRSSVKHLRNGDSIIVFPDIDYTAGYETEGELYRGFLMLGQMYRRVTGKSLRFVPLYIDEEKRVIKEFSHVSVDCFKEEHENAYAYLKSAINGRSSDPDDLNS